MFNYVRLDTAGHSQDTKDIRAGWPDDYIKIYDDLAATQPGLTCGEEDDDSDADETWNSDTSSGAAHVRALMKRMQIMSYSTAFSGIDSPGTAFAQLRAAAYVALGMNPADRQQHPEHVHAIDAGHHPSVA